MIWKTQFLLIFILSSISQQSSDGFKEYSWGDSLEGISKKTGKVSKPVEEEPGFFWNAYCLRNKDKLREDAPDFPLKMFEDGLEVIYGENDEPTFYFSGSRLIAVSLTFVYTDIDIYKELENKYGRSLSGSFPSQYSRTPLLLKGWFNLRGKIILYEYYGAVIANVYYLDKKAFYQASGRADKEVRQRHEDNVRRRKSKID